MISTFKTLYRKYVKKVHFNSENSIITKRIQAKREHWLLYPVATFYFAKIFSFKSNDWIHFCLTFFSLHK